LLLCSSLLPLGDSQHAASSAITPSRPSGVVALRSTIKIFWRRCWGKKEDFCKGSLSHSISLLCYRLALVYFICIIKSKNKKKIVYFLVVIFILLALSYSKITKKVVIFILL
jgi:hypothetical protein